MIGLFTTPRGPHPGRIGSTASLGAGGRDSAEPLARRCPRECLVYGNRGHSSIAQREIDPSDRLRCLDRSGPSEPCVPQKTAGDDDSLGWEAVSPDGFTPSTGPHPQGGVSAPSAQIAQTACEGRLLVIVRSRRLSPFGSVLSRRVRAEKRVAKFFGEDVRRRWTIRWSSRRGEGARPGRRVRGPGGGSPGRRSARRTS